MRIKGKRLKNGQRRGLLSRGTMVVKCMKNDEAVNIFSGDKRKLTKVWKKRRELKEKRYMLLDRRMSM